MRLHETIDGQGLLYTQIFTCVSGPGSPRPGASYVPLHETIERMEGSLHTDIHLRIRTLIAEAGRKLRVVTDDRSRFIICPFLNWDHRYVGLARDKINCPKSYFDFIPPSGSEYATGALSQ